MLKLNARFPIGLTSSLVAIAASVGAATAEDDVTASSAPSEPGLNAIRPIDSILAGDEGRRIEVNMSGYAALASGLPQFLVGRASFQAELKPDTYLIRTRARTAGIAAWFSDYSSWLDASGYVTADGLKPQLYKANDDDGKKNRKVTVEHQDEDVRVEIIPEFGDLGDPAATLEQKLEAMDPLSALMNLALGPDATEDDPCRGTARVFDGKQRYNLHLSLRFHGDFQEGAWNGPAYFCKVEYEQVAGFKKKTDEELARERADLKWLVMVLADMGPGEARVPVKIEGRSKKRGKITLLAKEMSYEPLELLDRADINRDAPKG
ncbi:MAG: DUF3108 domain-containing protein [Pseudomonadota bacterium]